MSGPQAPQAQLDAFLAKFTPEVERQARAALERMRVRLPGAWQLVYDNYNALAIAFGANDKLSAWYSQSRSIRAGSACFSHAASNCPTRRGCCREAAKASAISC